MKKAILITGSSGDIGKSLSKDFKEAGWYVIGIDILNKRNRNESIYCDKFFNFDLVNCKSNNFLFNKLINSIKSDLNKSGFSLCGLINNAAMQIIKPFEKINTEEWDKLFSVNFFAPVELSKALLEDLKENEGSILNIGSIHRELTKPCFSAYATSKSALIGLTSSLAVEFGHKVRVNAIEPAAINTSMLKEGFKNNLHELNALAKLHPTKRLGQPEDISKAALFLMDSDQKFVNGCILKISGGIHSRLYDIY